MPKGFRYPVSDHAWTPLQLQASELGAFLLRTETELIIKSRRVVPARSDEERPALLSGKCERLLDESEFLSPYGVRSVSRVHEQQRSLGVLPTTSHIALERFFAELTTRLLRRGVHHSVAELEADIRTWITTWNSNPYLLNIINIITALNWCN